MTARKCPGLNLYEKVFKYRDSLFLIPYHFQITSAREYFLSFDKDAATKHFELKYIFITSDEKENSSINEFYEKINYILFNPKTNKLVFYVDDNFKSPQARKAEAKKKVLKIVKNADKVNDLFYNNAKRLIDNMEVINADRNQSSTKN